MADSQQLRERTLVVLKPDAVVRGLAGRIIQRFEDAALKIVGVKMREMDADFARKHYFDLEERLGAAVYNATASFMQRGPVIAFVLEGEDAALKIIGVKMREIDADFARKHYFDLEERHGAAVYNTTAAFMQRGPVIAFVLEGEDAVATVRKIVGTTYPNEAQPGSIRGDFAHQSKAVAAATGKAVANLVHASGNREEAQYEVNLWFGKSELFEYKSLAEAFDW